MKPIPPSSCSAQATVIEKRLKREIAKRKATEIKLKERCRDYDALLSGSLLMQEQLRHLSHKVLQAQEEERKRISRELHDEISQILTGITVKLAALKLESTSNSINVKKKIDTTQRLLEKSVATIHRFARELRPAMLDDLGLVPALLAYMKEFGMRTGIRVQFNSVTADKLKTLDSLNRIVIYRVVQEALTNVAKHAKAELITVSINLPPDALNMEINDNGISFNVNRLFVARKQKHLGIIGMRERVEMVGGVFAIESEPDKGTTISIQIPFKHNVA
ncbi:MAG: sensor histidine kinase [Victivallaceae bacterium]|nr:sensor histidine kinase [Victivallaceae bacterium]